MDDADYFARRSVSAERPLPSPDDTPYATPSARLSSYGSHQLSSTPLTPPPLPPSNDQDKPHQREADQSAFSPADLTSTLHASLVQQILSLRREVESKQSFIEDLESSLSSSRTEVDSLQTNLKRTGKETRALKRELQLHEDGSLSAMEVLAKERDESHDANTELRRRVESAQKRIRTQEDDNLKLKAAFEQERIKWTHDRRNLERRAHVAEQRLTAVVDEVAVREAQSLENSRFQQEEDTTAGMQEDRRSDTASLRSIESPEQRRPRNRGSITSLKDIKHSLADELDMSDQDDDVESKKTSRFTSPSSIRDAPSSATSSPIMDRTASKSSLRAASLALTGIAEQDFASRASTTLRDVISTVGEESRSSKVLGLVSSFENQLRSVVEERERNSTLVARSQSSKHRSQASSALGLDEEALLSLARAPTLEQAAMAQEVRERFESVEARRARSPSQAHRRRTLHARTKSDPLPGQLWLPLELPQRPLSPPQSSDDSASDYVDASTKPAVLKVSTGTQTNASDSTTISIQNGLDQLKQVPAPPQRAPPPPPSVQPTHPLPAPFRAPPPIPGVLPSIAIHSPDNDILQVKKPAVGLRSVATQTHFHKRFPLKSKGTQTDKIRVDTRPLMGVPLAAATESVEKETIIDIPEVEPEVPRRTVDVTTQARDGEPLRSPLPTLQEHEDDPASPNRKSLYSSPPLVPAANKDTGLEELDDLNLSDIEFGSALSSKPSLRSQKYGSRAVDLPAPVPEHGRISTSALYARSRLSMNARGSARSSLDKGKTRVTSLNMEALDQYQSRLPQHARGTAAESPSPSMSSGFSSSAISKASGPRPPFAIPSRKSSREQYAKSRYARGGYSSPTRLGARGSSPIKIGRGDSQKLVKKQNVAPKTLRKARSAAAIDEPFVVRPSDTVGEPAALGYTKLARMGKQVTSPPKNVEYEEKKDDKNSPTQVAHVGTMFPTGSATAFSSMQHSVVDAITATTIGEWMFKYIRKRKSFASSELDSNNERHKRWVWLSPYDRTIMWSTKQPATNSALMGKAGRKLSIQSVLDVKDEAPAPKEARAQGVFNRSILVLTPARALKFTAVSRERHYLWLTALSFLAHHNDRNAPAYEFHPPEPSFRESMPSSERSRASSYKNPLRAARQDKGSGQTHTAHQADANAQRAAPKAAGVGDSAFAPAVPRVPHSRKRSMTGPSRGRSAAGIFSGLSSAQTSTSKLTMGNSTSRVQSVGGASSRRSLKPQEEDMAFFQQRGRDSWRVSQHSRPDTSPRSSLGPADFGGNQSFFDAVGVMKLDAFVRPGPNKAKGPAGAEGAEAGAGGAGKSHRRNQSSEAFIGPPDIARSRPLRRTGTLRSGQTSSFFGF